LSTASLGRAGNLTGINFFAIELTAKRLALLHELVKAVRIAVLAQLASHGFIACPASKLGHTCSNHCCRIGADCRELRALGLKGKKRRTAGSPAVLPEPGSPPP
jgi:hypothetical protein